MDRRRDASAESSSQGEGQRLLHRKIVRPVGRISEIKSALVGPDPLQESEGEGEMSGNEKSTDAGRSAAERKALRVQERKRRSPIMKKLGQHSTKIGNA